MTNIIRLMNIFLVKLFSLTKIDSLEEYTTLKACSNFYTISYDYAKIELLNKEAKAQDILENFNKLKQLYSSQQLAQEGVTKAWISEAIYVLEDVTKNLSLF